MRELDMDTLMFFDAHRDALPIFTAWEAKLYEHFPETQKRVQKTQITYYHKHSTPACPLPGSGARRNCRSSGSR